MSRATSRLKMASGFRANVFDPLLIVAQIAGLQCSFYISLGFWLFIADSIGGVHRTLDQIFNYREFEGTVDGWFVMGAGLLNSFTCAVALWWIVRRAKQTLDFAATVHIIHFLLCIVYGGFPLSWAWWVTMITSLVVMTLVGEWLCWRTELKAIPLNDGGGRG